MMNEFDLTGTLINSYVVCNRKSWLNSRKINPNKLNSFLLMGSSYNNNRTTQKRFGNIEINNLKRCIIEYCEYSPYENSSWRSHLS